MKKTIKNKEWELNWPGRITGKSDFLQIYLIFICVICAISGICGSDIFFLISRPAGNDYGTSQFFLPNITHEKVEIIQIEKGPDNRTNRIIHLKKMNK